MNRPFPKLRRWQAISLLLAITWLPYTATRCVENPFTHDGCGMLATAHEHPEGHHSHAASHDGVTPTHQHHDGQHSPVRTCCELTGKCNIKVTAPVPSIDPPALLAVLPAVARVPAPTAYELQCGPTRALAHGPPTYLRNAVLRI
jgi:hypothetical protein